MLKGGRKISLNRMIKILFKKTGQCINCVSFLNKKSVSDVYGTFWLLLVKIWTLAFVLYKFTIPFLYARSPISENQICFLNHLLAKPYSN